jgi:hypothetical protein
MYKTFSKYVTKSKISFGLGLLFGASFIEIIDKCYANNLKSYILSSHLNTYWNKKY